MTVHFIGAGPGAGAGGGATGAAPALTAGTLPPPV